MDFSKNELNILIKIATSSDVITAYELSAILKKDYSIIHKACKKLISEGILESETSTNDKNVPKKVLKFTLFGFCAFVTQSGWFFGNTQDEESSQQFLKNWKHLHETIEYYYSLFLRIQKIKKIDESFMGLFLHRLYFACENIIDILFQDMNDSTVKLSLQEMIRFHNPEGRLYWKMFDVLTEFFCMPIVAKSLNYSLDEVIDFFRESKGYEIIKQSFKGECIIFETKLYCYNKL